MTGLDGRVYVFGGKGTSTELASTTIYDPATNTWSPGANMPPARRLTHGGRLDLRHRWPRWLVHAEDRRHVLALFVDVRRLERARSIVPTFGSLNMIGGECEH